MLCYFHGTKASGGKTGRFGKSILLEAALIFEDPEVIESVDPRNDYGEQRIQALGRVDGTFYVVA
jgi:uncharacterized DUF497 family protein